MLFLIFGIFIIVIGISIYLARPSFGVQKSRLMNLYSSILSDMNVDFRDQGIGAKNLSEISESIKNFSCEIDIVSTYIRKENPENQKWFTQIIQEFTYNLHLWIDRHADELTVLENTISELTPNNNSEKSILELTEKRLENHIQILQKI